MTEKNQWKKCENLRNQEGGRKLRYCDGWDSSQRQSRALPAAEHCCILVFLTRLV